jgi:hypothetical protein
MLAGHADAAQEGKDDDVQVIRDVSSPAVTRLGLALP